MSVRLEAPWPAPSVITLLPSPNFSDVQTEDQTVNRQRSMNNTLYTYAKSGATSKLTYTFALSRMKSLELQNFVETMIDRQIKLTNHKSETWLVYIDNNPFEITQARRSVGPTGRELDTVSISFEGVRA